MADETNGSAKVTFTVKELLADMDSRFSRQLNGIERDMGKLKEDVAALKHADKEQRVRSGIRLTSFGVGAACIGVLMNTPAALWYLGRAGL